MLSTIELAGFGIDKNHLLTRNNFQISSVIATTIAILILCPGLNILLPKTAFASVSITPSSPNWFGPGLLRVVIVDTSQNSAGASITPHIDVKRGSTTLASADPLVRSPGSSGTFEIYLTTSNAPFAPAFPSNPNDYVVGRINSHPQTEFRDFSLTLSTNDSLRDGDSVVVTYDGQSESIQFAKSKVVASVDRAIAGDGNKITLTLTDQNANVDPTAIDSFDANQSVLSVVAGNAVVNYTGAKFIEEGQNSAAFDLVLVATSATGTVVNPNNGATLSEVQFPSVAQFTLHGFSVYQNIPSGATSPYDKLTPDPQITSSQSVTLQNSDATITIGNNSSNTPKNATQIASSILLEAKPVPAIIRAGDPFWINATVLNNSTSSIQFSRFCSPSFSVAFEPTIASFTGRPCNIMPVLETLAPGQNITVRIPGFDSQSFLANQSGTANATVSFQYQLGSYAGAMGNVSRTVGISVLDKNPAVGKSFGLGFNQSISIEQANLGVRFVNVTEDSRCPSDVTCIWAGRATAQLDLSMLSNGRDLGRFNVSETGSTADKNSSITVNGFTVKLQSIQPYPDSKTRLQLSDYVATLLVTRNNATQSLFVAHPIVRDGDTGQAISHLSIGGKIRPFSNFSSTDFRGSQTFLAVFEIRSLNTGITEYIGFANATASGNGTVTVTAQSTWTPSDPGAYQIRVFAIDQLSLPRGLSELSVSEFSVR